MTVEEQVIEIVADQLSEDASNITRASKFIDDLKADSLDLVELVMSFEDKFGISVPDEDYEKIVSVGDAITYMEAGLAGTQDETGSATTGEDQEKADTETADAGAAEADDANVPTDPESSE